MHFKILKGDFRTRIEILYLDRLVKVSRGLLKEAAFTSRGGNTACIHRQHAACPCGVVTTSRDALSAKRNPRRIPDGSLALPGRKRSSHDVMSDIDMNPARSLQRVGPSTLIAAG